MHSISLSKVLLPFICNFYAPAPSEEGNIPVPKPLDGMMLLLLLSIAVKLTPALDRFPMETALLGAWRKGTYILVAENIQNQSPLARSCPSSGSTWFLTSRQVSVPLFKKPNTHIIYPHLERFLFLLLSSLSFLFLPHFHQVTASSKAHGPTGNEGLCGSPHAAQEPEQASGSTKAVLSPKSFAPLGL